jgi:isoquinoline 1-oxidoreductase beta subunit
MMVCEELQCDWSKVRPEYASVNRDAREMAPDWTLNVMGNGATDPLGGGEPEFRNRDKTGTNGIPDSLYRRMRTNAAASVRDGRYYLQLAGAEARERLLLAAARVWRVPVEEVSSANSIITHGPTGRTTSYGQIAPIAAQTPHPNPEGIRIKPPSEWTLMGTERKNLDVPLKVSGKAVYGIDVKLPGMKWAAVKTCPVYGGKTKSYDFEAIRNQPGILSALEFPIPDPALIRGRLFSGGVAVIADSWYQAKTALDEMPIEWDVPPEYAALNTANIRAALMSAIDKPGIVRVNVGDFDGAFSGGAKIVEATYSTPYLPRARMEPGNATVLVTDDRVDIWVGDQSPAAAMAAMATARRPNRRSSSPTTTAAPPSTCCGRARKTSSTPHIGPKAWRVCAPRSMPMAGRSRGKSGLPWTRTPLVQPPASTKSRVTLFPITASQPMLMTSIFPWARGVAWARRPCIFIARVL